MRKVTTLTGLNQIGPRPARLSKPSLHPIGPASRSDNNGTLAASSPAKIIALQSGIPLEHSTQDDPPDGIENVIALLYEHTGNDFSSYKRHALHRRIARRMALHEMGSVSDYAHYLRANLQEVELLFKEILIGVTSFFRDAAVWNSLRDEALPALLATHPGGKPLQAWVPACSTGQEAYTLAIVFKEALERLESECRFSGRLSGRFSGDSTEYPSSLFSLRIFATDLDADAIDKARRGVFSSRIAGHVSAERLRRFFVAEQNGYRVSNEIREMIVFAPQNIAMDPPPANLDILACRNLLIYFEQDMQSRLISLFHHALNHDGLLLLGSAETIGPSQSLFSVVDSRAPLYRRMGFSGDRSLPPPVELQRTGMPISVKSNSSKENARFKLQAQAEQFLLQNFSPAAALVNRDGDILYFNGPIEKYLEPAAGQSNWNVYAMAREGLLYPLAKALKKVVRQQTAVTVTGLTVRQVGGAAQAIDLTITAIDAPNAGLLMIVFTDVDAPESAHAASAGPACFDERMQFQSWELRDGA